MPDPSQFEQWSEEAKALAEEALKALEQPAKKARGSVLQRGYRWLMNTLPEDVRMGTPIDPRPALGGGPTISMPPEIIEMGRKQVDAGVKRFYERKATQKARRKVIGL